MNELSAQQRIIQTVFAIPKGRVATYGQIAQLSGLGRGARLVGTTLKKLPKNTQLPWHRIINSKGEISLPQTSPSYQLQRERLVNEGVVFTNNKVPLKTYQWRP